VVEQGAGPVARGDHGDDGGDADDDAETGQHRAALVDQEGTQGHAHGGEKTHGGVLSLSRRRASPLRSGAMPTQAWAWHRTLAPFASEYRGERKMSVAQRLSRIANDVP